MDPKISVIVPIYGVENYIEKCAHSLFSQTLDDIEYIFINDCTQDKSMDVLNNVLEKYPQRKKNVVFIENETNMGQVKSRKIGVDASSGDFIIHCDPDDWIECSMYEKLYNKAIKEDADFVWCHYYRVWENESRLKCFHTLETDTYSALKNLFNYKRIGSLWTQIIHKDIAKNSKIFWPKWNYSEDLCLVFQYILLSKKMAVVDEYLYYYRMRNDSISFNPTKARERIFGIASTLSFCENSIKTMNFNKLIYYIYGYEFDIKARYIKLFDNAKDRQKEWFTVFTNRSILDLIKSKLPVKRKLIYIVFQMHLYEILK